MRAVETTNLGKTFRVAEREAGLAAAMRSLFRRKYKEVKAVEGVTLSIDEGEVVGFLGPNGAGKTTTLKMLTGLLHPTAGDARVLGHTPWKRENTFLRQISLLMGQRSQLNWDLPAVDSFDLQLAIYGVSADQGKQAKDELIELLEIGPVIKKQVRTLSLGERMKCEICMALLYRPRVLFLDEPTIGVDITMQARIRQFIAEYNRKYGATVMLTSHYMADTQALCKRVIVINHGRILFDGPLATLIDRLSPFKLIQIDLDRELESGALSAYPNPISSEGPKIVFRIAKADAPVLAARLLKDLPVADLTIQDPPIEDVIEQVFASKSESPA